MKKKSLWPIIALLSCHTFSYAGSMANANPTNCLPYYFGLEGGYTGNDVSGYKLSIIGTNNQLKSTEKNSGATGRISAGMNDAVNDDVAVNAEIGYGYYGRTDYTPILSGLPLGQSTQFTRKNTFTGFDALAGIAYTRDNFSLYIKAGALVQNMTTKTNLDFTGLGLDLAFQESINHTAVLPEIKIGGGYNVVENCVITLSYVHAFGGSPETSGAINLNTAKATFNDNFLNPSLNSLLLGVQFAL